VSYGWGTHCKDLVAQTSDYIFIVMTSQRDNTMRIRRRAMLEYVQGIDATRYIEPCICHTIRHIHGNDVIPLREVWFIIILSFTLQIN